MNQLNHMAGFINDEAVILVERYIAQKETTKKIKSNCFHQLGAILSHSPMQEDIANNKGAAIQCTKHRPLANAPQRFGLFKTISILTINATQSQK